MPKVDLHTHSTVSKDGGINEAQYKKALESGRLDIIAITDHNRIDFALKMQQKLGNKIIVGEEIMSSEGEIIGLFLTQPVPPSMSSKDTIKAIKDQGGLVYIPHPFETVRKGMHPNDMAKLLDQIDIIEICNGRAFFQNRASQVVLWAKINNKLGAASSDAHGVAGLGKTFTSFKDEPTKENFLELLETAVPVTKVPSPRALLYPKYNRLLKVVKRKS